MTMKYRDKEQCELECRGNERDIGGSWFSEKRGEFWHSTRVEFDATPLRGGRYAVRPIGQLGTCGFYPIPWNVYYTRQIGDLPIRKD
jgi:hypothetical protein